jgi:hypothetical protein
MTTLYGTIGYTILKNINTKKKLIIFADRHDKLQSCSNNIDIAEWFKLKLKSKHKLIKILLEEVPRYNVNLQELWSSATHTQSLKNIFLESNNEIIGLDIRPLLIPFSWELNIDNKSNPDNITLKEYIKNIDNFFSMQEQYLSNNLLNYSVLNLKNKTLGKHFKRIKQNYNKILINHLSDLNESINNKINILTKINDLLDEIMEWNICANIILYDDKPVIVHVGLAHSEKIIPLLKKYYKYDHVINKGINKIDDLNEFKSINGCVYLDENMSSQFGGYKL